MFRFSHKFLNNTTKQKLKIIEAPRDAIQGIKEFIPTEKKVQYLRKLLQVGYDTLDCVSFVPAKFVPQLADSEQVLKQLNYSSSSTENGNKTKLLAVVANVRGASKAIQFNHEIDVIGYPLSASETFQKRNTNRTIQEAIVDIGEMQKVISENNSKTEKTEENEKNNNNSKKQQKLGVCISMAFGNPYKENVTAADVRRLCQQLHDMKVPIIYFADTVGSGSPEYISKVFSDATEGMLLSYSASQETEEQQENQQQQQPEFGIHLHSNPYEAEAKVEACIQAGCRRFDGAIFGLGGCMFAQDKLVGNIPSELIVKVADRLGFDHGIDVVKQQEAKEALFEMLPQLRGKEFANA